MAFILLSIVNLLLTPMFAKKPFFSRKQNILQSSTSLKKKNKPNKRKSNNYNNKSQKSSNQNNFLPLLLTRPPPHPPFFFSICSASKMYDVGIWNLTWNNLSEFHCRPFVSLWRAFENLVLWAWQYQSFLLLGVFVSWPSSLVEWNFSCLYWPSTKVEHKTLFPASNLNSSISVENSFLMSPFTSLFWCGTRKGENLSSSELSFKFCTIWGLFRLLYRLSWRKSTLEHLVSHPNEGYCSLL